MDKIIETEPFYWTGLTTFVIAKSTNIHITSYLQYSVVVTVAFCGKMKNKETWAKN